MLAELDALLVAIPPESPRKAYIAAVIEDNVLGKLTVATRKLTLQRLSELYALDPLCPLFRLLRGLWSVGEEERPMLALLCALARDPLLRATAEPVLALEIGEELSRQRMTDAVRAEVGDRLNASTIDGVARNTSSSWVQSGHLKGRTRKFREAVRPGSASLAYSLVLGYLQGLRGSSLFATLWARVLCGSRDELRNLAGVAKRHGYIDLKTAGDIIEVGFSPLLTNREIQESRVTH